MIVESHPITITICQIPVHLRANPIRVDNPDEAFNLVDRCISFAVNEVHSDYVVFPEYSFCPESMTELYREASMRIVIVGGSYQNATNHNETIIAAHGELYRTNKVYLSPLETALTGDNPLQAGDPAEFFLLPGTQGKVFGVLTCLDYMKRARITSVRSSAGGTSSLSILFSPACNDKPLSAYREAEATHANIDSLYSVLCNASKLTLCSENPREINCGGSAIFGLVDPSTRIALALDGRTDERFENLILRAEEDFEGLITTTLQVPYIRHRQQAMEFSSNPTNIRFEELSRIVD